MCQLISNRDVKKDIRNRTDPHSAIRPWRQICVVLRQDGQHHDSKRDNSGQRQAGPVTWPSHEFFIARREIVELAEQGFPFA